MSKFSTVPYGNPPKVLRSFDLKPSEHMIYLYLPIQMKGAWPFDYCGYPFLPQNLSFIIPLLEAIRKDQEYELDDKYIYVTAKTQWVEPGAPGNRPGWHADGYGSGGDLNYIWYDMNPTEFAVMPFKMIPDDDFKSMAEMERQINSIERWGEDTCIRTYPNKTLLRLDESVVHRVNPVPEAGLRTFIKVSVSRHKYNLKGNSHNYLFHYDWEMHDRKDVRNTDNKDFI